MEGYRRIVTFTAAPLQCAEPNDCDACGIVGKVTAVRYPVTSRATHQMSYREMWLCDDCLTKMKNALVNCAKKYGGESE